MENFFSEVSGSICWASSSSSAAVTNVRKRTRRNGQQPSLGPGVLQSSAEPAGFRAAPISASCRKVEACAELLIDVWNRNL